MEDPTMEAITFLYSLVEGMSNKSYGFFTAKMAGIKNDVCFSFYFIKFLYCQIIRAAFNASREFEEKKDKNKWAELHKAAKDFDDAKLHELVVKLCTKQIDTHFLLFHG